MQRTDGKYRSVHWHNSLIFRTIFLCVVLVLCLLGSVYVITSHYYMQVIEEMRSQTEAIAQDIMVHLTAKPDDDLRALEKNYKSGYSRIELNELDNQVNEEVPTHVSVQIDKNGRLTKVARTVIHHGDRRIELTASVTLTPQSEILHAFRNQYLVALTLVFVVALGLMVYVIRKTLRPLGELSDTFAEIGAGHLKPVEVRNNYGEILALEQTFNEMVSSLREKDEVEAKLRQAQRLSAIGNLAAGVAHDLRNPLNAIKLLSSHALDTLGETPETERAARQLRTIREEVNRLEDIVSGFLSLAKERELRTELCAVDKLLEECIRLVKQDAESRDIRLIAELRAGDTKLMLDPKQWPRAILNVLINAMEACPKGGRVRVFSRVSDSSCEIEVRDDGLGLTQEAAEHAFDAYYTTKPTGTGLGLSITRGIIEEHGGTVALTSAKGQGCQALVTMPLQETRQP